MDNLSKAYSEEEQRLIVDLMALTLAIHCKTQYCGWIDFSGHVDSMEIHLTASQKEYQTRVLESEFDTAFKYRREQNPAGDSNLQWLQAKKDVLERVLTENNVDVDGVERHARTSYDNFF